MVSIHLAAVAKKIRDDVISEIVLRVGIRVILQQIFFQDIPIEDVNTQVKDIEYRKTPGVDHNISIKAAWKMLRGKEYYLSDIVMTETEFKEFIDRLGELYERK